MEIKKSKNIKKQVHQKEDIILLGFDKIFRNKETTPRDRTSNFLKSIKKHVR